MLSLHGNEDVRSINPVVAETKDGYLNDIRGRHVGRAEVFAAIQGAKPGPVDEGAVGAGTAPVGRELGRYYLKDELGSRGGGNSAMDRPSATARGTAPVSNDSNGTLISRRDRSY